MLLLAPGITNTCPGAIPENFFPYLANARFHTPERNA